MTFKPSITLSKESITELTKLCSQVAQKNTNQRSVTMATGIANFMQSTGRVSQKQAEWLCHNLDYFKVQRPAELASIVLPARPRAIGSANNGSNALATALSQLSASLNRFSAAVEALGQRLGAP